MQIFDRVTLTAGLGWAALLIGAAAPGPLHAATHPPVEAYARLPQVQSAALSPNGRWFAAIMNREGGAVVVTRSTDGDEPAKAVFTSDGIDFTLAWVHWVSDDRLVVSVHFPDRRRFTDTTETRLVAVDRDGGHAVTLAEPSGFDAGLSQFQDEVVDWLPGDGHHLLLQARSKASDTAPAVYRVDVDTGRRVVVMARRFGVLHWLVDASHRVRVGTRQKGTRVEVLVSDAGAAAGGEAGVEGWRTAWTYELYDRAAVQPLGFGRDPNLLYVLADREGHRAVWTVDLRDAALPRSLVLGDDNRDIGGELVVDPVSGNAVGVQNMSSSYASAGYWDADAKRLVAAVDAALPARANHLLQLSADGQRYLVYSSGNGQPGQFLVGQRAQGTLVVFGRQYPDLSGDALVKKRAYTVTGRTGSRVPVLLTLPDSADPRALPLVVVPRGGAIVSDAIGEFDPLIEFLANRGYAVLQVNARHFIGGGAQSTFERRYSADAQDDVADAVKWAVERGTASASRVCVMGASFGGYAALMSAERMPDLFKCAVSVAGVSDLVEYGRTLEHYVNASQVLERQLDDIGADRQRQRELSPQNLAARFKVPVLLVHGTADRTVPYAQSQAMAAALTAAGKPVTLVSLEGGDHVVHDPLLRARFYRELEGFFASQIGEGQPPAVAGSGDTAAVER